MIYDLNDKINFGKYTGVEIREIWVWDKRYFNWLIKTCDNFHLSEESEEEVRILRSKFKNPKKDKSRKLNAPRQW